MNDVELERNVRDVLSRQARLLTPPALEPEDLLVGRGRLDDVRRWRPRRVVAAAAAAAVTIAAVVVAIDRRPSTTELVPAGQALPGPYAFETSQVRLTAASFEVQADRKTFVPAVDVQVHGDPGEWNRYTTLELTWMEHGVEMRTFIYFASDGLDWWAYEIRTYNGHSPGDWIESTGEYFRSRLGVAYTGDLQLGSLRLRGLEIEAFRRPAACTSPAGPAGPAGARAVVPTYATIDGSAGEGMGFGVSLRIIDTAACAPTSGEGLAFAITSSDPAIASVVSPEHQLDGLAQGIVRADLMFAGPGTASLHVVATDSATGQQVSELDIPIIVR